METIMLKTDFYKLASDIEKAPMGKSMTFTSEAPEDLEYYELEPSEYNVIWKTNAFKEEYYIIIIGRALGHTTVAKDIYILTNGNVNDKSCRINGIAQFLKEYYQLYMKNNKTNDIYRIID